MRDGVAADVLSVSLHCLCLGNRQVATGAKISRNKVKVPFIPCWSRSDCAIVCEASASSNVKLTVVLGVAARTGKDAHGPNANVDRTITRKKLKSCCRVRAIAALRYVNF